MKSEIISGKFKMWINGGALSDEMTSSGLPPTAWLMTWNRLSSRHKNINLKRTSRSCVDPRCPLKLLFLQSSQTLTAGKNTPSTSDQIQDLHVYHQTANTDLQTSYRRPTAPLRLLLPSLEGGPGAPGIRKASLLIILTKFNQTQGENVVSQQLQLQSHCEHQRVSKFNTSPVLTSLTVTQHKSDKEIWTNTQPLALALALANW